MTRKKQVVAYARVTGPEEAVDARALAAQTEAITSYCSDQGIELAGVYSDGGVPGRSASFRSGLFRLLDEIELRGIGCVVVQSVARIIGDGEIGRQILKELENANVTIVSLTDAPDTVRRDTRRITASSSAALKSATTKIRALRRGKAPAGRAPYGYRRTPVVGETTTRLEVVPTESEVVRWIFREYLRRRSMAKVAKGLAERGISAPGGKAWSRASVAWILGNEVYIGNVRFGAAKGKGEHEPIIAPVVFHKTQKLRVANRRTRSRDGDTERIAASITTTTSGGATLGAEAIGYVPRPEELIRQVTAQDDGDAEGDGDASEIEPMVAGASGGSGHGADGADGAVDPLAEAMRELEQEYATRRKSS